MNKQPVTPVNLNALYNMVKKDKERIVNFVISELKPLLNETCVMDDERPCYIEKIEKTIKLLKGMLDD